MHQYVRAAISLESFPQSLRLSLFPFSHLVPISRSPLPHSLFTPQSLSNMRFSPASLLAILAVSSTSLAAAVTRTTATLNPDPSVLQNVAARNVHARAPAPAPAPMTNAQRMARGLPPKAPARRSQNQNQPQQPKPSSVPPYVPFSAVDCLLY